MSNRRKFLKSAGSTALFTSLGSSFFIGCSTSEEVIQPDNNNNNNNNVSPDDGYSVDGGNYIIELNHSNFSILKTTGGWYRFDRGGMLLVNVGQNIIRAFSSSCPHAGCRTSWRYTNNNFNCTCHGAVFTNDGTVISGPANSDLESYNVTREEDIITVST
ncbi:MAG: Rieske (2Fe-2S) protein [Bacteroidota bacterium]|nr:Rieske (2Fe-2S) protein [Bacteroidota bacterium]|tara:strand:- start:1611 stop:2090 length:480 start_codon:yes stop_codon:yes gene_type:complete